MAQGNGKLFQKGNPGNPKSNGKPGGRPRVDPDAKAMFKGATPEAAKYLISLLRSKKARGADKIKAAEVIIDHGLGKAVQEINLNGNMRTVISFDPILKEELGEIADIPPEERNR